jgi:hypothetical protein
MAQVVQIGTGTTVPIVFDGRFKEVVMDTSSLKQWLFSLITVLNSPTTMHLAWNPVPVRIRRTFHRR